MRFALLILCSLFITLGFGQSEFIKITLDSTKKVSPIVITKKKRNPKTAALISALAPGGGQIYNGKYWKAPIVWGGLVGIGLLWIGEDNKYQTALTSYYSLIDTDPSNDIPFNGTTNLSIVQSTKNVYRNQRDMYLLLGILFYGLNIIDATVDAHFANFDVSDDVSMNFNFDLKSYPTHQAVPSLTFNFNLKK